MPLKNICQCDLPPGGQTVCEPHQLAVCSVSNGVANKQCIDPPTTANAIDLCNWAISMITGMTRSPFSVIGPDEIQLLKNGRCFTGGMSVNFNLPDDIKVALAQLDQKGQADDQFLEQD